MLDLLGVRTGVVKAVLEERDLGSERQHGPPRGGVVEGVFKQGGHAAAFTLR